MAITTTITSGAWTRCWAVATLSAGMALGVAAQPATTTAPAAVSSAASASPYQTSPQRNIRQIYDAVEAAGFRDVRDIEWSDGRYEVKAFNAQGQSVRLELDGNTGAVLRSRIKR